MEKYKKTNDYIKCSWEKAVRKNDCNKNFVLPYDFVPPCVDKGFVTLFYWDTYFTNKGLIADGLAQYAYYNIENLKFCLKKFGCVPNFCREDGADFASQPPLLVFMADDFYKVSQNKDFLSDSYGTLCDEYKFWMSERLAPNGLNCWGTNCTDENALLAFFNNVYAKRVGLDVGAMSRAEKLKFISDMMGENESGEDFTPRFGGRAHCHCAVDLNGYLYGFERTMARFCDILANGEQEKWLSAAAERKILMEKYCLDKKTGVFFDYDYVNCRTTEIYCAACYVPFAFGLSDDGIAVEKINSRILLDFGVSACENIPSGGKKYQWGFPNSWAPHAYFAYTANQLTGNAERAKEIAVKYLNNVDGEFNRSGKLFEKYDAACGGKATVNEYGTPEMLGWTAGVFKFFIEELF